MVWTLVNSPTSRFAEGIRSIKLTIDMHTRNGVPADSKVIGFTSALPNEGKSTIAAAVAELCAQVGEKIIVVDCDLRNPSLTRIFAKECEFGIIEAIKGDQRPLDDLIWHEPETKLAFLPVGSRNQASHTSETLVIRRRRERFSKSCVEQYHYVIVDSTAACPDRRRARDDSIHRQLLHGCRVGRHEDRHRPARSQCCARCVSKS